MVSVGDKLVVKKDMGFLNKGDIVKVTSVDDKNGMISFAFGENFANKGVINDAGCEEYFEKAPAAPSVTLEQVEEIMAKSEITAHTVFGKCTIVACKLPNGFVIVESSACVSPENYNEEMGIDICLDRIADKIFELEGYRLQEELHKGSKCNCECCDCEQIDECLEVDLDCDDCTDYECPFNPNDN